MVASAAILQAPGGKITLEITVQNTGAFAASLDSLEVGGGSTCTVPQLLKPSGTYTCSTTIEVVGAVGEVVGGAVVATLNGEGGSTSEEIAWEVAITPPEPYVLDVAFGPGLPLGHVVVKITNGGAEDVLVTDISASGAGVSTGEITCEGEGMGGSGGVSSKEQLPIAAGASASCIIELQLIPWLFGAWGLAVTVDGVTASGLAAHGFAQLLPGD